MSVQYYIEKYGEEEGKVKYPDYLNRTKFCHTKEDYIKRYGEERGILEYEKHKNDCIRTKETFIKKWGEDEGLKRWENYCKKQSETNTFEYKQKKYGWTKEQFDEYNKSRAVTLENLIKKYGEDEGLKRWENYCYLQSYKKTKEYLIEKYGEEKGLEEYYRICDQKILSIDNFIRKYGKEVGEEKYKEYISGVSKGFSKISNELFKQISSYNVNNDKIYYGENEKRFKINFDGIKIAILDFYNESTNKAIEFYGDYWHRKS